jgi:hypothetical protein
MAEYIDQFIAPEAQEQLRESKKLLTDNFTEMQKLIEESRKLSDAYKTIGNFKGLSDVVKQQEEISNRLTESEKKYTDVVMTAAQKRQRAIEMAADKATAAEKKRIDQAVKRAEIAERQAEREAKALEKLNNAYEQLKVKYNQTASEAKKLGVEFGVNDSRFKAASASAKGMYDQLLKVELAVGHGQRQVGQYNLAAEGLKQTLRELPAFANSFQTGLMAISNNLPTLIDGINQLKQKNKELTASGGQAVPVWRTLAGELMNFGTIAAIMVTAATFIAANWDTITKAFKKAKDEIKEFTASANESAAAEMSNAKTLQSIAANTKQSMEIRLEAVKKLQSEYPSYLGNLSQEAILAGRTADAMERLNKALINKAIMEAYSAKVAEQAKKFAELRDRLAEYEAKVASSNAKFNQLNTSSTNQYAINAKTRAALDEANAKREVESIKKQIAATETEMKRLQGEADKFGNLAAGLILPDTDKVKKEKKPKNEFIKAEDDLLKALNDRRKQQLEIDKDTNKAISEDVSRSLQDRLLAYNKYYAILIELAQMERDLTIDVEQEKLNELARKHKTATAIERKNIENDMKASFTRMGTATDKFNADLNAIQLRGKEERTEILLSENAEWLQDEQTKYARLKQLDAAALMATETLLRNDYSNKKISRKQFNAELEKLQLMAHKLELDNEIKHLQNLLASDKLTAEKRIELEGKLATAQRNRAMAEKGVKSGRNTGRFTDSLAMMFGTPEEGQEEQYLQAFYDSTVNLAKQASDAIIEANNRRFVAEREQLERQMSMYREQYETQRKFINDTVKDENDKNKQLAQLNAQKAEKEAEFERKRREIAIKQARFNKAAAMAEIVQSTAVAIMKTIAQLTVAAAPVVALIAATGAVQLANAASMPLPAYKHGTDYHVGGAFIAGDGGEQELIVAPNKKPYWSASTSTLYNEVAGTKVIPMSKINDYAGYSVSNADMAGVIVDGFDRTGKKLASVIMASKPDLNIGVMAEQMRRERYLQGK